MHIHHSVQNALLDMIKDMILEQVKEELCASEFSLFFQMNQKTPAKKNKSLSQCDTVSIILFTRSSLALQKPKA